MGNGAFFHFQDHFTQKCQFHFIIHWVLLKSPLRSLQKIETGKSAAYHKVFFYNPGEVWCFETQEVEQPHHDKASVHREGIVSDQLKREGVSFLRATRLVLSRPRTPSKGLRKFWNKNTQEHSSSWGVRWAALGTASPTASMTQSATTATQFATDWSVCLCWLS